MKNALRPKAEAAFVPAPPAPVEHRLAGHSGARLILHRSGSDSFVRKTAASAATSQRLKAQAAKQHAFWMLGLPFPKVRAEAMDADGRASFDMNYIPGRTIADIVVNGGIFEPTVLLKAVERLMQLFLLSNQGALPSSLFEEKIREIVNSADAAITDAALLAGIRDRGRELIARDWRDIPKTPCHGDLTLENILLAAGKSIAFIDCDEIFASSFWLDFGKLFQDLDGHWCIRALYQNDAPSLALLNAAQRLDRLRAGFHRLALELDPALPRRLPQLAGLGLFRAIPYARSAPLIAFICRRVRHLLKA